MKTQILLTLIGAAALVSTTLNVNAGTTLLSPRAAGNQAGISSGITAVQPSVTPNVSPRAAGNRSVTVAAVANDINPTIACRNMIASPKAIQACAANSNMPGCNKSVLADNTTR